MRSLLGPTLLLLFSGYATAFIGFGKKMYDPACAVACFRALRNIPLECSVVVEATGGHSHGATPSTSSDCRASDSSWLTTLALCVDSYCAPFNVPTSARERWWEQSSTNSPAVPAKWSYTTSLANVQNRDSLPELPGPGEHLNATSVTPRSKWGPTYETLAAFESAESSHSRYSIVIVLFLLVTPVLVTMAGRLPYMTGIIERVKPYLVYPSSIGTYHVRPLPYLLGNVPTLGQTIFIVIFWILVIIFTAVEYRSVQPNVIYTTGRYEEILGILANRSGTLAYALLPILILFAGRNNLLLWATNWSHSTYLLLHRWVARAFGLLSIIHSIVELLAYKKKGRYPAEEKLEYWIWGAVATVAVSIMLVASGLYVRKPQYEVFLISHILLAIFVIAGCWYHIVLLFGPKLKWGYEFWIIAAAAVWFFDRVLRFMRILKNGVRRSKVTEIGGDIVRIDVQGVRWGATPGQHCYAYFPTLKPLRPWENHPFSVVPSSMLRSAHALISSASSNGDTEKSHSNESLEWVKGRRTTTGLTFFVRKSSGLTQALRSHNGLLTLLDGPYPNNPTEAILRCDRVLLIGGGIGITGLLPWIHAHHNVKLCWSVKNSSEPLARLLESDIGRDKDVRIGSRLEIEGLLEQEVQAGWEKIGVVVCGPGGLCDDARAAVVAASKRGKSVFELEVDAYTW